MSGSSLAGVIHSDLTVWTNFPVCRPSNGISETSISETENKNQENVTHEGYVESTTLQIRPATKSQYREFYIVPVKSGAPLAEEQASGAGFSGSIKEENDYWRSKDPSLGSSVGNDLVLEQTLGVKTVWSALRRETGGSEYRELFQRILLRGGKGSKSWR